MAELTDSGVLLRMAYRAMLNAGIDADAVLAELGLDPSILNVPDLRTPHDGQEWFWEALAKVSNDEHVGLHLGKRKNGLNGTESMVRTLGALHPNGHHDK